MDLWTETQLLLSFMSLCLNQSHMNTHRETNNHHAGTQPTKKRKLHSCAVVYPGGGLLPFCISRLQPNSNTQPTSKWQPSSFQKSPTQQLQYWCWHSSQQENMEYTARSFCWNLLGKRNSKQCFTWHVVRYGGKSTEHLAHPSIC